MLLQLLSHWYSFTRVSSVLLLRENIPLCSENQVLTALKIYPHGRGPSSNFCSKIHFPVRPIVFALGLSQLLWWYMSLSLCLNPIQSVNLPSHHALGCVYLFLPLLTYFKHFFSALTLMQKMYATEDRNRLPTEHFNSIKISGGFPSSWKLHLAPEVLVKKLQCTFANVMQNHSRDSCQKINVPGYMPFGAIYSQEWIGPFAAVL